MAVDIDDNLGQLMGLRTGDVSIDQGNNAPILCDLTENRGHHLVGCFSGSGKSCGYPHNDTMFAEPEFPAEHYRNLTFWPLMIGRSGAVQNQPLWEISGFVVLLVKSNKHGEGLGVRISSHHLRNCTRSGLPPPTSNRSTFSGRRLRGCRPHGRKR